MMTSNRPYLMRAMYEWILDNELTPHVIIDAEMAGVEVPRQYIEEGRIILNIAPRAVQAFLIDNECLGFSARFAGKPYNIYAPIGAVRAIYASENNEGMMFDKLPDADIESPPEPDDTPPTPPATKRPALRVVK
ncbi:MAG: ClpXP protease specificity-enhancing factor [Leucothrix sp.]